MGISITQYRASIGLYNMAKYVITAFSLHMCTADLYLFYIITLILTGLVFLLAGDIELNPGPKNLSMCHLNVRGIKEKMSSIRTSLAGTFDIIAITETNLSDNSNFDLTISGYQPIIRLDRYNRGGGGVAVYVSNSLAVKRHHNLETPTLEALWLEIRSNNNIFLLCVCYRPPDVPVSFWDDLQTQVDLSKQIHMNFILTGDLNADPSSTNGPHLSRFADNNHLDILVHEPTRITETSSTILDQFLSNMSQCISDVTVHAPLSTNDHCTISLCVSFKVTRERCYTRRVWYYKRAKFSEFRQKLKDYNWDTCFGTDDVDHACDNWTNAFLDIAQSCIPSKLVTIRPDDSPWYNSELRQLKRHKDRLHHKAKRRNTPQDWQNFRNARNEYVNKLHAAEQTYNTKLASELKEHKSLSPKRWWHIAKSFLGKKNDSTIPPIIDNDTVYFSSQEKANIFNEFFLSHASINTDNATLPRLEPYTNSHLQNLSIQEKEVLEILKNIDVSKSSGPDEISPKMLKEAAPSISPSLTKLINLSLSSCRVPKAWKKANVLPIHKKNEKAVMNNYRPISLLSCVSKILERVVFKHVFNYFRDNFLITVYQSGFIPGDSTVNQLVQLYHMMCDAVDKKKELRIVFCDISKAFDRVWHAGIICKLDAMGIKGPLLKWFNNYLQDRYQRVVIGGACSSWENIQAGVPQGSVLGPLLFLVYINDISRVVNSNIRMFADDTALFITVDDPVEAATVLNTDLQSISQWADQWLVTFSPPKTESMLISLKHHNIPHPVLKLDGSDISDVSSHKHLGITLTQNLSWDVHIDSITSKAGSKVDVLSRLMYKLDRQTLEIMYTSFIRPSLEYGDVVWANMSQCKIRQLELIQKRAGRIISGAVRGTSTEIIYSELGWDSLEKRRYYHKMLFFHKIVNGNAPMYLVELLPGYVGNNNRYSLRNNNDFITYPTRLDTFYRSFFPSAVRDWNQLDPGLR